MEKLKMTDVQRKEERRFSLDSTFDRLDGGSSRRVGD